MKKPGRNWPSRDVGQGRVGLDLQVCGSGVQVVRAVNDDVAVGGLQPGAIGVPCAAVKIFVWQRTAGGSRCWQLDQRVGQWPGLAHQAMWPSCRLPMVGRRRGAGARRWSGAQFRMVRAIHAGGKDVYQACRLSSGKRCPDGLHIRLDGAAHAGGALHEVAHDFGSCPGSRPACRALPAPGRPCPCPRLCPWCGSGSSAVRLVDRLRRAPFPAPAWRRRRPAAAARGGAARRRPVAGFALHAVAAQGVHGLRCQAQVGADGDAASTKTAPWARSSRRPPV